MLINGEKFACEACVRGHRVSSCHHQDRPLVHVNKKGRPVSQCQHCRGLRKARSQHVKCDCHDKAHSKEDCPHEKSDGKSEAHTCCCQHGSRCTCSLKKEHLDTVPEDIPQLVQPKEHHKQRLNHNSHEAKTTIFTNGHHKPVHKFNDAHNQLGNPYKIPSRSNSLHGHREIAQRSTDSLPLTKFSKPFHESPLHNSMTEAMDIVQRKVRSEHNSPILGPQKLAANPSIRDFSLGSYDPSAYAYSPFGGTDSPATQTGSLQNSQNASQQDLTLPERFPENWFMSYAQAHEYEPPPHAKFDDLSSVDWSSLALDSGGNSLYGVNRGNSPYLSQQGPYQTFDLSNQISQVGITSSSGDASEVGEHSPPTRWGNEQAMDQKLNAEAYNDFGGAGGDDTSDRYRLSGASFFGTPQATNVPGNGNRASLDIDDIISQTEAETKRIQMQNQLTQMQLTPQDVEQQSRMSSVSRGMTPSVSTPGSTATGEHPYTVREAQRYAHMEGFSNDAPVQTMSPMPPSSMAEDPSWSVAPDMTNPELALDDERDDEDWVR